MRGVVVMWPLSLPEVQHVDTTVVKGHISL